MTSEAAAIGTGQARDHTSSVATLARNEAKRMLRNPALLAGAAVSAWLALPRWFNGRPSEAHWATQTYEQLTLFWAPLHLGAFIAATMMALREREDTTSEVFAARPLSYLHRTHAMIIAGLAPMGLTFALVTVNWLLVVNAGGIPTGGPEPVRLFPTMVDAVYVTCLTGLAYTAGIAFGRTIQSRIFNVVAGVAITWIFFYHYWMTGWFPAYFLGPYVSPISAVAPNVAGSPPDFDALPIAYYDSYSGGWFGIVRDTDLVVSHTTYLAGLTVLLAAHALRRSDRDARTGRLVALGTLLAVGGFALQILTYSGTWRLLGSWWSFLDTLP